MHSDDPERCYGEGGGRGVHVWECMYTRGGFMSVNFNLCCFNMNLLCFPDSSVGKESTCSAGNPSSIPGLGRSPGEGIGYPLQYSLVSAGKESTCNAGGLGSIPGLGRTPGEGTGYPPQRSGLENSTDCRVYGVTQSWTKLK